MGIFSVSEGKYFEPLTDDKYQVEIYGAEPFTGTEFQSSVPQEQVKFTFMVLDQDKTYNDQGKDVPVRGRMLWDNTTTKTSPVGSTKPTKLTQLTSAVFGHELTQEEVDKLEVSDFVGKQLCVMVGQKTRQDGTIGNKILSYSKATKQLPKYDDSERMGGQGQTVTKKSAPAVADVSDFEAEMDAQAAKKKA